METPNFSNNNNNNTEIPYNDNKNEGQYERDDNEEYPDYYDVEVADDNINSKEFPDNVNQIIYSVLKRLGYQKFFDNFRNNPDTLPLIANAVNELAKTDTPQWYDYKSLLIGETIKRHSHTWASPEDNIIYSETPYGQVSFHVFNNEKKLANDLHYGINPDEREWSGDTTQGRASKMIEQYISEIN